MQLENLIDSGNVNRVNEFFFQLKINEISTPYISIMIKNNFEMPYVEIVFRLTYHSRQV